MTEAEPRWLTFFRSISAVPRRSGDRSRIVPWLMDWAADNGFSAVRDKADNIRIDIPASPGRENSPSLVLQGHMDMVCEKIPGSVHDFSRDPIRLRIDGEWLLAEGTSLGADNGIALALAFDLATDQAVLHPALEILITSDEEVGLTGAQNLENGFIKGRRLINLDSEEEGVFTIGCAGGRDTDIFLPVVREAAVTGAIGLRLSVGGLTGGHSGIDIACQRANANLLLARMLREMIKIRPFRLLELVGGSAHNAIPRDAAALVSIPASDLPFWKDTAVNYQECFRNEWEGEKTLAVSVSKDEAPSGCLPLSASDTLKAVNLIRSLPHGVQAFSSRLPGFVETSNNLAIVSLADSELRVLTNQRSSVPTRLAALSDRIAALAELAGARVGSGNGYPPWPSRSESPLLETATDVHRRFFGREPKVEMTHAGLECGIIGNRYPGMDMISMGPDIIGPHSPDERMNIASATRVRSFLGELLARL
jgi:dipeptidase D